MALDDADQAGTLDIDLITASLRADTTDVDTFVEALAAKLEEAVPKAVRVERRRGGLRGPKLVQRITVDAGDRRLELRTAGAEIDTRCSRLSGGIVLKSDEVDIETWLTMLSETLAVQAKRSQTTRQALERLLYE
jgi:hypothetical protein